MKVYISGKITGLDIKDVEDKFNKQKKVLGKQGYEPLSPLDISPFSVDKTWEDYMIDDIKVLFECDAIFMLSDWGLSKGARIEYQIAKELGLEIMFEK